MHVLKTVSKTVFREFPPPPVLQVVLFPLALEPEVRRHPHQQRVGKLLGGRDILAAAVAAVGSGRGVGSFPRSHLVGN